MAKHFISTSKERGIFPFSFDTMNDLILEAAEHAKKRRTPFKFTNYALFVDLQQCLCIGLFGQESELREWLVGSLDTELNGCTRLMRVGKIEELIGERIFDWELIQSSFVWAVAYNETKNTFDKTVLGDIELCWLNINKEQGTSQSSVVIKARGCNRESRRSEAKEIDFFRRNRQTKRVIEHRWFGVVCENETDVGWHTLPHMTHNFHEVISGNYSMLYLPHSMGK